MGGANYTKYEDGKYATNVFIKGGSGNPFVFRGKVTTATSATEFASTGLEGQGNDAFVDWYVFVFYDTGGAAGAPQGEHELISDYVSSTGTFTHTTFTADLAVGDEVFIVHRSMITDGGDYSGDIEIFDSFEYPTDALLQAEWIEGGNAGNPTRSATSYYGQYGMQTVVTAGAVGNVHRLLTARNMKTLSNLAISARSNKVGGDEFRFTLYDSSGNHSYWTQTIVAQDTWETFNINPHSARSGGSATLVDLEDIVKIDLANLTASSTYIFDLIRFESLVASKIGLGYDGLDDTPEESSSVRGHLMLINDNITGATKIFHEQVDTPVTVNAILASETDIFDLNAASTRYIVRSLRLKSVDPGAETITVRLRELINDVSTIVDTFTIDTANFGAYHTLMDMFGVPHLAGDDIHITVQASAAGPYAITGQYSHAKTNV